MNFFSKLINCSSGKKKSAQVKIILDFKKNKANIINANLNYKNKDLKATK